MTSSSWYTREQHERAERKGREGGGWPTPAELMRLFFFACALVNRLLASFNQAGFHFNTGVGIDEPEEIEED